jgi:uncharacterized protein (DUF885 family)
MKNSAALLLVEKIASSMFEALARAFPIACASDEFYYFPQVQLTENQWSTWDDFSSDAVADIVTKLSGWENELDQLNSNHLDLDTQIDIALLQKLIRTLREQLSEVRTWQCQPTFYLTLVCIGLAEAMKSEDPSAKHERARSLSAFLDQASHNLDRIPVLFRDLGLEMVSDTRNYFIFLENTMPELQHALSTLDRFEEALKKVPTRDDFALPPDLLERVVRFHLNCDMDLQEVNNTLDQEIHEMQQIMDLEAMSLVPNESTNENDNKLWSKALKRISMPAVGKDGLIGLYQSAVNNLAEQCVEQGLVSPSLVSSCPVCVTPMPPYLAAIRTASSYSIPPKYPSSGGMFYVNNAEVTGKGNQDRLREYEMLSAHETYPGHHLLDTSRWSLTRAIRRFIEQPIFYEGWACFAEELMRLTGYFGNPGDRFLLAKRRLWRAIRGKVDLNLQIGKMNFLTAVEYLKQTGMSDEWAMSSVRKYPLNPGYQLCYTIGIRRFMDLFNRYGQDKLQNFVHSVLEPGEINFKDLERYFNINNL